MQFFFTIFLAALTFGVGSSTGNFKTDEDNNSAEAGRFFWRTMIEDLGSMPTKAPIPPKPSSKPDDNPSAKPSLKPITARPTPIPPKPSSKPDDNPSAKPSLKPFTASPTPIPPKPSSRPDDNPSAKPSLKPFTVSPIATPAPTSNVVPTSVPATSAPSSPSCQSIEKLICSVPEFSTLCDLSQAAGLGDALSDDIFTLFAPTNVAFDLVPAGIIEAISGVEDLRRALLYHAVPEVVLRSEDLVCGAEVMMANRNATVTTCVNDEIYQVGSGNSPGSLPRIVAPDAVACNGVIHAVDQVILQGITPIDQPTTTPENPTPSPIDPMSSPINPTPFPSLSPITSKPTKTCQSISEVVCTLPEFETLCSLVGDADLTDALGSEDKFTLFAPINTAFESLSLEIADKVTDDVDFLENVLLSHAVADNEVFSTDLVCNEKVVMSNGDKTTTICAGDKIYQAGEGNNPTNLPEIIAPNGVACNGVIHAIDHVILPSTDTLRNLRATTL